MKKESSLSASKGAPAVHPLARVLRNFEELRKAYDLAFEDQTLKAVLHKMIDRLDLYEKIVAQVLQPEEFHALYEANAFTDMDKPPVFELYKRVMIANREVLRAVIKNDEKDLIATIDYTHREIIAITPEILVLVSKMKESWTKISKKGNVGYVG